MQSHDINERKWEHTPCLDIMRGRPSPHAPTAERNRMAETTPKQRSSQDNAAMVSSTFDATRSKQHSAPPTQRSGQSSGDGIRHYRCQSAQPRDSG